ncbi:hypothetical protein [Streptomyces sp. NPDC051214]|uniref:hypothetical protein n=1 Tax=Streptomyces sp. NPDC051214 TaxID=3155282 RepID=UPI00341F3F07
MIVQVGMKNTKRVVVALSAAAAAFAVAAPAHADESPREGSINLPDDPRQVIDGVRTGLEVTSMGLEAAQAR